MHRKLFIIVAVFLALYAGKATAATTADVDVTLLVEEITELVYVGPDALTLYTNRSGADMTGTTQSGSLIYTTNTLTPMAINVTASAVVTTPALATDVNGTFTVVASAVAGANCVASVDPGTAQAAVAITDSMAADPIVSAIQGVFQCRTDLTYAYTVPITAGPQEAVYTVTYTLE
jgi:hypothetical protein